MASTKKTGRNPFAFFSGEEELGSSDEDSSADEEEAAEKPKKDKTSFISQSKSETDNLETGKKLPPPDKLFDEVSTPDFLTDKVDETAWERFVKSDIKDNDDPPVVGSTHAMPPPKSYDILTESKPSLGDPSTDDRPETDNVPVKRPLDEEDHGK